jgi:hypothetical protein
MNTTNMPGFTAEASLYKNSGCYKSRYTVTLNTDSLLVLPSGIRVVSTYQRNGMYCFGIEDDDLQMSYEACFG